MACSYGSPFSGGLLRCVRTLGGSSGVATWISVAPRTWRACLSRRMVSRLRTALATGMGAPHWK